MELRLKFDGEAMGRKLKINMDKAGEMVRHAMQGAAEDAAEELRIRTREDIAGAGKFGERWFPSISVESTQRTIRVITAMQGGPPVSYWPVFEYGATIFAHNPTGYLHFPIDKTGPSGWVKVPSVTIPQKFHLREIIASVAKELRSYYSAHMRG